MDKARQRLHSAERIVALTGAGISAESGIPTFRDAGGLWRNFRPEELATPDAFFSNPNVVWEWYDWRRDQIAHTQPNAGHLALAALEARKPGFTLVTQNVDGLHDRAGSRNIVKLHGDIMLDRCIECGAETSGAGRQHRCHCGGLTRPGVVWFGETLPPEAWNKAEAAVRTAQVVLVVGTSAVVYPAAGLIPLASSAGAFVIEVNPEETQYSPEVDLSLRGKAGEILPQLLA